MLQSVRMFQNLILFVLFGLHRLVSGVDSPLVFSGNFPMASLSKPSTSLRCEDCLPNYHLLALCWAFVWFVTLRVWRKPVQGYSWKHIKRCTRSPAIRIKTITWTRLKSRWAQIHLSNSRSRRKMKPPFDCSVNHLLAACLLITLHTI